MRSVVLWAQGVADGEEHQLLPLWVNGTINQDPESTYQHRIHGLSSAWDLGISFLRHSCENWNGMPRQSRWQASELPLTGLRHGVKARLLHLTLKTTAYELRQSEWEKQGEMVNKLQRFSQKILINRDDAMGAASPAEIWAAWGHERGEEREWGQTVDIMTVKTCWFCKWKSQVLMKTEEDPQWSTSHPSTLD